MAGRGRPRSERTALALVVQVKLRLYPEDQDLIAFFTSVPRGLRAAMVKQALRSGVCPRGADTETEDDVFSTALDSLVE